MRVNIDEIKAGLERSWDLAREEIDAIVSGDRAGYRARASAHVEARLEKVERRVRVRAGTVPALSAPCGRCLAPMDVDVPVQFELTLVPREEHEEEESPRARKEPDRGRSGGSFEAREAEEETYSGKTIDLDPIVREQILLALPPYPVCKESCKGLCPVCGANLNERECGCERRVPDPRWAGLEKLKR